MSGITCSKLGDIELPAIQQKLRVLKFFILISVDIFTDIKQVA